MKPRKAPCLKNEKSASSEILMAEGFPDEERSGRRGGKGSVENKQGTPESLDF